jgi:hypothetical protein
MQMSDAPHFNVGSFTMGCTYSGDIAYEDHRGGVAGRWGEFNGS